MFSVLYNIIYTNIFKMKPSLKKNIYTHIEFSPHEIVQNFKILGFQHAIVMKFMPVKS